MDPTANTQSFEAQLPRQASGLSQADKLTIYGPLGIFVVILLAAIAVMWRDAVKSRRESLAGQKQMAADSLAIQERMATAYLAGQERRDRECKAERDEFRETMIVMAREAASASTKNAELWRDHGRELRQTLDSASRKIGSRE